MEYAYQADQWQALYATVAGATAALTGLLFVALSLNLRTIIKVPAHRARAREILGCTLSLLVLSLLMLIPGQDRRVLGSELIAGCLVLALRSVWLHRQTFRGIVPGRRVRWALRLAVVHLGTVAIMVAGISLIVGQFGGFYWLGLTVLVYTLWSLNNAWLLVVQAAEAES
jgi:modulator of FtsH protease